MNARTALFTFLLSFFFISCKKPRDGTTIAEGQVRDLHTGAAVANATVSLMRNKSSSVSAAYNQVRDWQADEQGRFSFSFEGDDSYDYTLMASKPLGHYTPWNNAPSLTPGRKNKDVKVPVQAPAWVRVRLVDEQPLAPIIFYIQGCYERLQQDMYILADTSFIVTVDGGVRTELYYWITKNNIKVGNTETVHPQGLDTTLLEIKY